MIALVFTQANSENRSTLTPPVLLSGSSQAFHLDSTLEELPLYDFRADLDHLGTEVAQMFERYPQLPGVILTKNTAFVGMISRRSLLEYLLRPFGTELFLHKPLNILHSYDRSTPLILHSNTPILAAAQQALRRSFDRLSNPIVVQFDDETYRLLDAYELNIAYWQLRGIETQVRIESLQVQMLQSEKMANLGRLVDGISHEILDPVSFIWGNLSHIADYSRSLLTVIEAYEKWTAQTPHQVDQIKTDVELDYIREDLPRTLDSIRTGADRLSKLANGLQNFCHIGEVYPRPANLHECLDAVLLLLKSRLTSEIKIVKSYGHVPPVPCYISQLSQVFMNILNRAIDGLLNQAANIQFDAEFRGKFHPVEHTPQITITTDVCSMDASGMRWVSIQIGDNGLGISEESQRQLMKAFSSEWETVKETSLVMSYRIVTARHGGIFRVYSNLDKSQVRTVFELLLPLN
jgi:signal transduction histidine kinase